MKNGAYGQGFFPRTAPCGCPAQRSVRPRRGARSYGGPSGPWRLTSPPVSAPRRGSTRLAGRTAPRPNRCRRFVRRLLDLPATLAALPEQQLVVSRLGLHQSLDPDPDQAQPGPVQPERLVQLARGGVEDGGHVGGLGQGLGPGDRREVGEPDLDAHGAADQPGGPQPAGRALGQPQQLAADDVRVVDVTAEGLLGTDALVRLVRHDPALVATPGQGVQVRAGGLPQGAHQGLRRGVRDVADRAQPEPGELLLGLLTDAPQRTDRQRVQERDHVGGRDDEQAVGLAAGGGELGDELRRRDADRAGDALLVGDPVADQLADLGRPAEPADRSGDVEEGLVERQRLDHRGDRPEDLHHPGGHRGVEPVARLDHGGLRAQPPGPGHRHRGVHAVGPRLVRRREHDAARAAADDHRGADAAPAG